MSAWMESNFFQDPRLAAVWLDALLKSFVVLAFAGGLCLAWRRAAAATRHLIWFLGIAGLVLLPLLPFVVPTTSRPLWTVSSGHSPGNEIALSLEIGAAKRATTISETTLAEPAPVQSSAGNGRQLFHAQVSRNWLSLGLGAWALGALMVLLYPVLGRIQLLRMEINSEAPATSEWAALLTETSQMLNLRRRVVLLQSRASVMPLTWGWLRPRVLLPAEAGEWPIERRRIVLLHELAHVKRRDCLTHSITRVVCALYWFNPLAWVAARQMRIERERACDDLVLNGGCKASDYAGHLVEIATAFRRVPQGAGIAMARSSNLEQRVRAIVDSSRDRRLRPAGLVGVIISIAAVVFYIGGYKTDAAGNDRTSSVSKETLAQIEKFSAEKEAQSKLLAAAAGETILPSFQKYFDAAMKGDVRTVTNMYADFKEHHPQYSHAGGKDSRPMYRTSYWQPMLEISLIYDQFAMCDSKYTQEAARGIIDSITPGSIYFGGTDPGRGLPTAFSKSQINADPFYTLSQNPLADPTYVEYLREMYGEKRRILSQLGAARQADPEIAALDRQFQAAKEKAYSLEMTKPGDDAARQAADKAVYDLENKIDVAWTKVEKTVTNNSSAAGSSWSADKLLYIPTPDDLQKCFQDYLDDALKRKQENKLKPGEDVQTTVDDRGGQHTVVRGAVAVQAINARTAKLIFDKNPNREFYIEESFPHDWMYPHLEPNGLIMKINREPLAQLPDDVIQKDQDYWRARVNEWLGTWLTPETPVETVADFATKIYGRKNMSGFSGDPGFIGDNYAPKMFSKWRSAIANVYAWRLGIGFVEKQSEFQPKSEAEKQKLTQAADFAFKQAFAICPYSPEVVVGYVNFLTKEGRKLDALLVARAAAKIDPSNGTFGEMVKGLTAQLNSLPAQSTATALAENSEKWKQWQVLKVQREAEYLQLKALYEKLKTMSRPDLRKALPIASRDTELNELLSQYDLAQQALVKLKIDYSPDHPKYKSSQKLVDDLDRKIDERMEGIMLGWEARLAYYDAYLKTVNEDMEKLRKEPRSSK